MASTVSVMPTPRRALLRRAEPWLSLLPCPSYSLARAGCVDSPVLVAVRVHVGDALKRDDGRRVLDHALAHERLRKVREAIDVLCLVTALDPRLLWARVRGRGFSRHEAIAARTLERGGAFEVHVTLENHAAYEDERLLCEPALLERRLCRYFSETLDREPSTEAAFVGVRDALVNELRAAHRDWRTRLPSRPVSIHTHITTSIPDSAGTYRMNDSLVWLEQFIVAAETFQPLTQVKGDDTKFLGHLPIRMDEIRLQILPLVLSYRTLQVLKRVRTVRKGFVVVESVGVDPRSVYGSADQVAEILHLLAGENGLTVMTGPESASAIDEDGIDRADACETIIRGIADSNKLINVNLTGMLELCQSPID